MLSLLKVDTLRMLFSDAEQTSSSGIGIRLVEEQTQTCLE